MPHCIIEYSSTLETQKSPSELIEAVHLGASNSGLFNPRDIKVRSLAYDNVQIGDKKDGTFIHVMARILSGRTEELKTQLSHNIYIQLQKLDLTIDIITVEICDIERVSHQPSPD